MEKNWKLNGPWKLHAIVLVVMMIQLVLVCGHISMQGHCHTAEMASQQCTSNAIMPQIKIIQESITNQTMDWNATAGNSMNHQCHMLLLLIGGVEQNPGPGPHDDQVPSNEDILADLCAGAPSDEIRDCLRLYNHSHTLKKQKQEIGNKCPKSTIVAALEYLEQPVKDDQNKPECVNNLICRIQNYLPDKCSMCEATYCVGHGEQPLLICEICGQGSHNKCILDKFMIPDELRDNFGPEEALGKINPYGLKGLHFLCGACEESHIPNWATGRHGRPAINNNNGGNPETEPEEENDDHETHTHEQRQEKDEAAKKDPPPRKDDTLQQQTRADSQTICRYYKKGTCRYGLSGKGCPHQHPKPCKKLLMHGNKEPRGCTLGRANCDKFHPKMCPSSLTSGVCLTTNCPLRHVAGTKMPLKENGDNSITKQADKKSKSATSKDTETKKSTDQTDFLDAIRLLKIEMMEAMDVKLATLLSTQSQPHTTPPPPMAAGPNWNSIADRSYQNFQPWPPMYPMWMHHQNPVNKMSAQMQPGVYPAHLPH